MQGSIPGYYYDEVKRKYFKILPHHLAPPGSSYTREHLKREKRVEAQRARRNPQPPPPPHPNARHRPLIPSRILHHPLGGALGLRRETGADHAGPCRGIDVRTRAYARGLVGEQLVVLGGDRDDEEGEGGMAVENGGEMTSFVRDEATGGVFVGVHVLLRPQVHTSVWTSACAPTSGTIAIGTGTGIILIQETPSHYATTEPTATSPSMSPLGDWRNRSLNTPSDVLALEFLSEVSLAAGQRDGCVQFIDTRCSGAGEEGKALRIRHPSAVTGVKKIDENRMLVNGLKSSLRMYDLRYPHPASPTKAYMKPTRPILEFDQDNDFRLALGFDVNVETGLVAAGQEDRTVQLFSLHTAAKVSSSLSSRPFSDFPRCIRFSKHTHDDRLSLLLSAGDTLHEYTW
ncbi:MAG: hypothetical protein M1817_004506 [Caeruleum heppii]|nr:MAG: hypothetical protein M1817_004506 [Caeruleum heppii]